MLSKTNAVKIVTLGVLVAFVLFVALYKRTGGQTSATGSIRENNKDKWGNEPIKPIPAKLDLDPVKVALGEKLFNDTLLSHDGTISCATCHHFEMAGSDRIAKSVGFGGQLSQLNSPTVFNVGFNFKQFWDGRAESLEEQVDGPTHAGGEMGTTWEEVIDKLRASSDYLEHFGAVYPDGVQTKNARDAIAAFERSLITPNGRFDQYLRGSENALSGDEKEGYRIFKSVGCISCHQGVNAGGNLFQQFGVMGNYFADRGNLTEADLGRYNITHDEADKHVFKVPTLRNVSQTYPYFHDGSVATLEEAVTIMSKYQLGRELSPEEVAKIVAFLKTLDGEYKRYTP